MDNTSGDGGSSTNPPNNNSSDVSDFPPLMRDNYTGPVGYRRRHRQLHLPRTPISNPYASSDTRSDSSNLNSSLISYQSSTSSSCTGGGAGSITSSRSGEGFLSSRPQSATDRSDVPMLRSLQAFPALVKVEEDVIVMDSIDSSTSRAPKSGGDLRMKSTLTSLDSDVGLQPSLPKGQFAQGKEGLRPSGFISKTKLEPQPCRSYSSGVCAYGSKCRFLHGQVNEAMPSMEASTASKVSPAPTRPVSPIKQESRADYGHSSSETALDDRVEVTLPSDSSEKTSSKEAVKSPFLLGQVSEALPSMEASTASKVSPSPTRPVSPIKQESRRDYGYSSSKTALDDRIEVTLPSDSSQKTPSKEAVQCPLLHGQVNEALPSMEASTASKVSPSPTRPVSPIKQESRADHGYGSSETARASDDWCPLDDGIEVTLPSDSSEKAPSMEAVDAHIQTILYGPSKKKRLPVFSEFCPE